MANCDTGLALANEEEMFAIIEDNCGTLKKMTADDRMYTVGPVDFSQEQEFLDDEQIRSAASRTSPIKGRKNPGDFSFDTYVKPSGTKGTPPEHAALFQALMGTEAITAGTKVEYSLADSLDSLSIWVKKGHSVFAFRGATIQGASFSISGAEIAQISWDGNYMEQLWAGTTYSASISGSDITLQTGGAQLYREGMYINVGLDDNSGAGFLITGVNYTTDVITVQGTPSPSGVQLITPWWPSSSAEVGEPVHGKIGMVTVGGANCVVLTASVTMANNIKYYLDEKNNSWVAERFGRPGKREIEGELELYFLKKGLSYFYRAEWQQSDALIIPAGNVDGKIMELSIPYAEYRTPTIAGDEEFTETVPFIAVASATLNDEFKITFR